MKRSHTLYLAMMLLAALCLGDCHSASAQLQNGGFEQPHLVDQTNIHTGGTLGSWHVAAGNIDVVPAKDWQPEEGTQSIDLSGDTAGTIYQDVPTTPNQTYLLSFYLSGNPYDQPDIKSLNVLADNAQIGHFTFDTTNITRTNMGWRLTQVRFTATSNMTRLTFQSLNNSLNGPALDDVRLAPVVTPSHTHLLWNNSDGRVILWSIDADGNVTYHVFGPYTDGAPNTPWYAAALATGPEGKSHILWTNPDGRVILWTLDDTGNFSYAVFGPYTDGAPNTPWSAIALSVGADNVVRLLWTNPDHRVILWNVDTSFNFTYQVYGPYDDGAPNTPWTATALATGPDNVTRLMWNNPDGRVILWNVNNAFGFTYHVYGPYNDGGPSTPWSAVAVSVGPDSVTHLLWTNPDMRVILWNVDASFNFTSALFGPYTDGSTSTPWGATGLATGPDGLSHILWTNPDNRIFVWGVDSAFSFTSTLYGPYTDGAPQNIWNATAISAGP